MHSLTLNNGLMMPILGLGTWKSKPGQVTEAVKDAISLGYRHIDCAMVYGNEAEVGAALKAKMEDGTIKRQDIFITSKLWNTFHSKESVIPALKKSLTDLGLHYLDLYLIHWPMGYKENSGLFPKDAEGQWLFSDVDYMETWMAMEDALKQGFTKSIGVSNFGRSQIERIIAEGTIVPANHQFECNPNLIQKDMIEFCKNKGITTTAFSPLGSPDRPWAKPEDPILLEDPKIVNIAKKYNKTPAQLLIGFQVQRGVICIPKSVTKSRIEANMQVFDIKLTPDDIAVIERLNSNTRICGLEWISHHKYWPFHDEK